MPRRGILRGDPKRQSKHRESRATREIYKESEMKTLMRNKQWAEKYPELGTGPVPAEPYISPEFYELERDRVFRRTWINV